jgi:transcriptional regulator with XRE-family HTH domain
MDIREIRRQRLKEWFSNKPLPKREVSYISQLINGKSSFGEKAATRIENDYGMPPGYLSQPLNDQDGPPSIEVSSAQEAKLLSLFREMPESEKEHMVNLFDEKVKEFNRLFDELLRRRNMPQN